ncbi:MAG: glycosyltransferase [Dehalococcoidia bacterium]
MPDTLDLSVVIPTCNERQNVAPLLARIEQALAGVAAEVIVVDDSDDGTPDAIARHAGALPLRVIHREAPQRQGGLATAVLRGLGAARGAYVCVMDGDLQHPPETIPALLERAHATDADIVIASRNVAGGSNGGLAGPWRRFVSFVFGLLARVLFYEKLRKVKDPLSGFFLIRRSAVEGIPMRPMGYKISLEILVRSSASRVEEVPYSFTEREDGESKATLGTGLTFVRHAALLLFEVPETGRFWKFGLVGATGVVVYIGLLWLLTIKVGLPNGVAWATGAEAAVLSNFLLNRNFTWFERRAVGASALVREGLKYHLASAISVASNGVTFLFLTLAGTDVLLAGAVSVWVGVAISFLGAERFVFTTRRARPLRRAIIPLAPDPSAEPAQAPTISNGAVAPHAGRIDD